MVMMQIRNRKYEVGVLMGIGEGKSKIISQFIIEILIATILAFAVSFSVSQPIAGVVSDKLNSSYSTTSTTQMSTSQRGPGMGGMGGQFGPGQSTNAANKLNLDVSVNYSDIFKTMGIATGIAVISVLLPSIAIMRLKPKEILTRQE
ncbi:FtsX-like permease family protein [Terrilactibacillus sp. S3-3]|nr:FtsX-like permease family protein [Terrilactibacillus sp. S3-3]